MSTTAQQVFNTALALMDEADTHNVLKSRVLPILNLLRAELYRYSDTLTQQGGERPVCPEATDFNTPLGLDDALCQTVLPYGLAAHLASESNPAAAAFFQQRYEELLTRVGSALPSMSEPIDDGRVSKMARIVRNVNERIVSIGAWLGVNEAADGDASLRIGEASTMTNFRVTDDGALQLRPGTMNVAGLLSDYQVSEGDTAETVKTELNAPQWSFQA